MTKCLGRMALLVVVTCLAAATAAAPAAVAQTTSGPPARSGAAPVDPAAATAKEHYLKGGRFYDLGKYDDAIREFEAAYENKPDPAFLYNLAQSHRLAGHNSDAIRFYKTYLKYVPRAPNRAEIEDRIKALEKAGPEPPLVPPATTTTGPVPPPANPPPGTIPGETTTGPAPPPAGTQPASNAMAPPPAGSTTTTPPPGITPPPPGTEPPPAGTPGGPPIITGPTFPPPQQSSAGAGRRTAGIVVASIGGAFVVSGVIFGLVAKSEAKKVEDAATNGDAFDPSVEKLGKRMETLQWVAYGVGGAAVVTGVIIAATASKQDAYEAAVPGRVTVAPMAAPGLGGALVRVAF